MDTQVAALYVPPVDKPPPCASSISASVVVLTDVRLQSHKMSFVLSGLHQSKMLHTPDLLLALHVGQQLFIRSQHPPAYSSLLISEQLVTSPAPFLLCIMNTSSQDVTLCPGTVIAKATMHSSMPIKEAAHHLSDDIRLRPAYMQYIAKRTKLDLNQFQQLFHNGGDFLSAQ